MRLDAEDKSKSYTLENMPLWMELDADASDDASHWEAERARTEAARDVSRACASTDHRVAG